MGDEEDSPSGSVTKMEVSWQGLCAKQAVINVSQCPAPYSHQIYTPGSLPAAGSLKPHGGHSMGTALKGRQGSSGPQSLEVVQAGPSPEEGRMAPPCEVSPLRLSWQVSLGLSLLSRSGWGKGPLSHWTRHEGRPPHPLQLAGPALTSRALPEPGGAFRGLADGTSVGNLPSCGCDW